MQSKQTRADQEGETCLWALIERVNAIAKGDLGASIKAFRAELAALDDQTLLVVHTAFASAMSRAYDNRLWDAAHVIHGGCGDDAFWDFRAGLVAMGREVFTAALRDPDSLAAIDDIEERTLFEGFQYVPGRLVEERGLPSVAGEQTPEKPAGSPRTADEDLNLSYPRLSSRFHWFD